MTFFTISWPKVPLSLPATKHECGIFDPRMMINSISSTGVQLASAHLIFATFAFSSDLNLHELWTVQIFSSLNDNTGKKNLCDLIYRIYDHIY